ncbi:MAG: ABC transporter ATP-binding protein/permease [Magnetovibrio sp.]|nr:ABC transporter ATP-binding protein/permease [Magnetovibrio sp.]
MSLKTDTGTSTSRIEQLRVGWFMMTPNERKFAWKVAIGVLVFSAIDLLALSSILPLLGLITSPDTWVTKPILSDVFEFLGHPELSVVIPSLAIGIAGFLIIAAIGNVIIRHLVNHFGASCMKRLASTIATLCADAPLTWFLDRNSSVVARQINQDTTRWGSHFISRLFNIVQTFTLSLIAAILIVSLAPMAGLVAIFAGFVFFGILMKVVRPSMDRYARVEIQKSDAAMVNILQMLNGIKDVKLSHRSPFFVNLFSDAFTTISDVTARRATIQQSLPIFLLVFGQLGVITIVTMLWASDVPAIDIAEQTVLIALVASRLVPALNRIFSDVALLLDAYPAVSGLIELKQSIESARAAQISGNEILPEDWTWSSIDFKDVSFQYPGANTPSLFNIDLKFEKGKAYGLAGSSGAGKTTLADILLGLLTPTQGSVTVGNHTLSNISSNSWHKRIGYVPQHPFMSDDSLRANIAFGIEAADVDDEHVRTCMKLANIADLESSMPEGLDTPLGDRGTKISGGQRQRIAIARALYKNPDILVLDEATSALDTINEAEVQEAIRNLHGKITTVIIAHRLSTISWCDEILLLSEGEINGRDSYENLKRDNPIFKKMVNLHTSAPEAELC